MSAAPDDRSTRASRSTLPVEPLSQWADEQAHPWRYAALYTLALFTALGLSHAAARGWLW